MADLLDFGIDELRFDPGRESFLLMGGDKTCDGAFVSCATWISPHQNHRSLQRKLGGEIFGKEVNI